MIKVEVVFFVVCGFIVEIVVLELIVIFCFAVLLLLVEFFVFV